MRWIALLAALLCADASAQHVRDALRAGELICEFTDGYRRSVLAGLNGVAPRVEMLLMYEKVSDDSAEVLSTRRPGRRNVRVRPTETAVHLIEPAGASVRVTTLTSCEATKWRDGVDTCVRFAARHAWHFDTLAAIEPENSLKRQPSGAASGICETWRVD